MPDEAMIQSRDDPRLVAAMEENAAAMMCAVAEGLGGETYQGPDMTRYISGLPIPFFNGVMLAQLAPDQLDAQITQALAPFQAQNLSMIWMVGPGTQPADLGARLAAQGLTLESETPCMAIDIGALAPAQPLPGVTFVPVTTEEQAIWLAHVSAVGFGIPSEVESAFQRLMARLSLPPDPRWANHLALLDGAPVATCMTYFHSGVAGLYTIATLPDARRRGVAGELTRYALLNAQAHGYSIATLQASRMGFPVYRRLGFETIATFSEYVWEAPEPQRVRV